MPRAMAAMLGSRGGGSSGQDTLRIVEQKGGSNLILDDIAEPRKASTLELPYSGLLVMWADFSYGLKIFLTGFSLSYS